MKNMMKVGVSSSPSGANVVLRWIHRLSECSSIAARDHTHTHTHHTSLSLPCSLGWDLEGLEEDLEHSKNNLRQMIQDSDLVLIKTYGKAVPKKCRLSPDGWFQV